jgi:hypothetical protein
MSLGCSASSSSDRATNQIRPHFEIIIDSYTDGNQDTFVSASFDDPSAPEGVRPIDLSSGDVLTAKTDQDPSLTFDYDDTLHVYSVDIANAANRKTVTYSLARTKGTSAPSSTLQLLDAVAVTAPLAQAQVSRASGTVDVAWSNAVPGATMSYFAKPCGSFSGQASAGDSGRTPDTGSYSLPISAIQNVDASSPSQCIALLISRRFESDESVDPAFASGGQFFVTRTDEVDFTLVP